MTSQHRELNAGGFGEEVDRQQHDDDVLETRPVDIPYRRLSFPVGRVFGIPVRVHFAIPFLTVLLMIVAWDDEPHYLDFVEAIIVYGPLLVLTVLIHELGHCYMAKRLGYPAHSILLWPLGGLAFIGHAATPSEDLKIALAGPATHVLQAAFWLCVALPFHKLAHGTAAIEWGIYRPDNFLSLASAVAVYGVLMQLWLFAFNLLLPAYPLDGGRVLADLLLLAGVKVRTAAKVTAAVSLLLIVGLMVYAFYFMLLSIFLVAMFMAFSTLTIVSSLKGDTLHEHPMFNYPTGVLAALGNKPMTDRQSAPLASDNPVYNNAHEPTQNPMFEDSSTVV